MAISLHTAGTWNRLVTNGTVSIPSAVSAGDRLFLFASWKDYAITVTNPTGWTPVGSEFADGTTNAGNGTGSVKVMAWYRDWQSGDADPTITWSSAPTEGHVVIMVWSKGAGETWSTPLTATAAWPSSASQTISASGTTVVPDGSVVMGLLGIRDDSTGFTRGATTGIDVASGITWNGNYVESPGTHFTSTTGLDMSGDLGHRLVTTGGTVTLRMTATIDAAETGAAKWVVQGVTTGTTVTPGTAALTLTTFAPTVSVSDNKSATPGTAALAITGVAPTVVVSDNKIATPGTASLAIESFAPTVAISDNKFVEPSTAELITETFAPTVEVTDNKFVEPGPASLTITSYAPTVSVAPTEEPPAPGGGGGGTIFGKIHNKNCCCGPGGCACCPGWPQVASAAIYWTTANAVANDCNPDVPSILEVTADFGCVGAGDELGTLLRQEATNLFARVFCDADTNTWKVQYRSAVSGGGFESPSSAVWVDAPDVVFVCPDCADAIGGIATGTIDFTAVMGCEISGPTIVPYDILCHADVEIVCP